MDTNELTSKAYEVLELSEEVHHLITVHIGAMCSRFNDENDYLEAVCKFINSIKECPGDFIDNWDLTDEMNESLLYTGLSKLQNHIIDTIETPIEDRGLTIEEIDFG
jgi:hypothetical protein